MASEDLYQHARTTPHMANQIGRLSLMVAVEALLSTVGPSFTCGVGAALKGQWSAPCS
ncbi:hypothetical protein C2845_PM02G09490 [Panicum miliaceum]|uniref:Uncharacterized protein n=1 Tax=Panicum miliaceum TaxID=4540 RepID=A0A3L6SHK8_PANMI|nr:hypothetical protein C2845_PM02G09490 [Panicum miliaceum]